MKFALSILITIVISTATIADGAFTPSDIAWLVTSMSDSKPSAFPGANKWQIDGADSPLATAPNSTQDYGVKGGKYLRPPVGTSTFAGRSLSVGAPDFTGNGILLFRTPDSPSDTTFANEGLFLNKGLVGSWNGKKSTIRGKVSVLSPQTAPVNLFVSGSGGSFEFHSEFSGTSDAGLWFHSRLDSGNQSQTHLKCAFFGDSFSAFNGTLTFAKYGFGSTKSQSANDGYQITFSPDTGVFPGTLDLYPGANISPVAATSDFSVASMVLRDGPHSINVMLSADRTTGSCVRVTQSLSWPASLSSPIAVTLTEPYPTRGAKDSAKKIAIFQAPSGFTLNVADFRLERDDTIPHLPDYSLIVEPDGNGRSTLYLSCAKSIVVQTVSNTSGTSGAFTSTQWSNSANPQKGFDYLNNGYTMRSTRNTSTGYKFAGDSLSFSAATFAMMSGGVTIDDMRLFGNVEINNLNSGAYGSVADSFTTGPTSTHQLKGRMKIVNDGDSSSSRLFLRAYLSRAWDVQAEVSGRGLMYLYASPNGSGTIPQGYFRLTGLNTNYHGRILVACDNPLLNGAANRRSRLFIGDARNLGGACATWTYNALELGNYSELHITESLALNEPTRGIAMAGANAAFDVKDGVVFTCRERITYNGTMVKKGAGELALGGERPYFTSNGNTTPATGKNVLDIREGTLRPVSAVAFQGLSVVLTNAVLALDVPASNDDSDIGTFGMLNTESAIPFVLPSSGIKLILRRTPESSECANVVIVPICTVSLTASRALEGKFLAPKSPFAGYNCTVVKIENADGTVTFAAKFVQGLCIIVR